MKKYIVTLNHAGETVSLAEYTTIAEAETRYNKELRAFEGKEELHSDDNTDEWIYLSIEECVIDEEGEVIELNNIKQSKSYYRGDVL